MKHIQKHTRLILLLLQMMVWMSISVHGQSPEKRYYDKPLRERPFDREKWEESTRDIDYSKDSQHQKDVVQDQNSNEALKAGILKFVIIVLAIVLVAVILKHLLGFSGSRGADISSKPPPIAGKMQLEQIEDYFDQVNIKQFIREAISENDYPLAIRLYYLQMLKQLHEKKFIRWKKQKTNLDYTRELNGRPFLERFKRITTIFERIWYGNQSVEKKAFHHIETQFQNLTKEIAADQQNTI